MLLHPEVWGSNPRKYQIMQIMVKQVTRDLQLGAGRTIEHGSHRTARSDAVRPAESYQTLHLLPSLSTNPLACLSTEVPLPSLATYPSIYPPPLSAQKFAAVALINPIVPLDNPLYSLSLSPPLSSSPTLSTLTVSRHLPLHGRKRKESNLSAKKASKRQRTTKLSSRRTTTCSTSTSTSPQNNEFKALLTSLEAKVITLEARVTTLEASNARLKLILKRKRRRSTTASKLPHFAAKHRRFSSSKDPRQGTHASPKDTSDHNNQHRSTLRSDPPSPDHHSPDHHSPEPQPLDHLPPNHQPPDHHSPDHHSPDHHSTDHHSADQHSHDHQSSNHSSPDHQSSPHLPPAHLSPTYDTAIQTQDQPAMDINLSDHNFVYHTPPHTSSIQEAAQLDDIFHNHQVQRSPSLFLQGSPSQHEAPIATLPQFDPTPLNNLTTQTPPNHSPSTPKGHSLLPVYDSSAPPRTTPISSPNKVSPQGFSPHSSTINAFAAVAVLKGSSTNSEAQTSDSHVCELSDSSPAKKQKRHTPAEDEKSLAEALMKRRDFPQVVLISPPPEELWNLFSTTLRAKRNVKHVTPSKIDFSNEDLLKLATPRIWSDTLCNLAMTFRIAFCYRIPTTLPTSTKPTTAACPCHLINKVL
ncbi:unnamed protein product [Eruca vesicaria subsp. sativa]|uniref:Uncharacterized protein n=1 Tax=Eruca vesicaria subsp. sativa TaxID=29727 RepID=A0ABC8L923_ERUVS|nr:unnamed protein product [Eruca vesicaria subsp. sativa]